MSASPLGMGQGRQDEAPDPIPGQEVGAWLGHLSRTLKTCRLYDEANPTVVRFREDLASSLAALLARHGAVRLEVSSGAIALAGNEVHVGRSREDNLGAVLHRDGIRQLTLEPGIEASEVDSLVDQILRVTGPAAGDEDLVTLLWDANLPHVTIEAAPIEGEADGGLDEDGGTVTATAWPKQETGGAPPFAAGNALGTPGSRSDDWHTDERPTDLQQAVAELESIALDEIARFNKEREAGAGEELVTETIRILRDYLAGELTDADREDAAAFLPRLLREALAVGDWPGASISIRLLRTCDPAWSISDFAAGLCGPFAITTRKVVAALDRDPKAVESFLALAAEMGSPAAAWLMHVLVDSQRMQVRRPLARAIAGLLQGDPRVVLPWLADNRWYVVRNVVHILGWIGDAGIVQYLGTPAQHHDPRVRREVIAALAQIEADAARPLLMIMLEAADPALLPMVLQQLAQDPHESVTARLLALISDQAFDRCSDEIKRAVFRALATRGDAALPTLTNELNRGGLLSRRPEPDRTAIALCIARIGSPAARDILAQGRRSRNGSVRKACTIASATTGASDE